VGFLDREFSVGLKDKNTALDWKHDISSVGMFVLCFVGPMPNPQGTRLLGLGPNVFSDDGVLHVERYRSEVMDFLGRRLSERLIL
jgi:hypothetical protein